MKFSVIVTGYNQKELISGAIDSLLSQQEFEPEIIYTDDASTDGSVDFVSAVYGDRVRTISHRENCGPFIGRLDGIEASTGDYILFLDGDDSYAPQTLKVLAAAIERAGGEPDMVGFGVETVFEAGVDKDTAERAEKLFSKLCLGRLSGKELCRRVFIEHEMPHVATTRCYSRSLAEKISTRVKRERLYMAEDFYFSFVAARCAESFFGISDRLYIYKFGSGISTTDHFSCGRFMRTLSAAKAIELSADYAKECGVLEEYSGIFAEAREQNLYIAYDRLNTVPAEEKTAAAKAMLDSYGIDYICKTLPRFFWWQIRENSEKLPVNKLFPVKRDKVSTVAMFYHRMYNGGVERVISLLSYILAERGYRLLVITDEDINEKDYPLHEDTVRLVLGKPCEGRNCGERHLLWKQWIKEYDIDLVLYHAWLSPSMIWDMLSVKSCGAAFVTHSHGPFFTGINEGWNGVYNHSFTVRQSDALAVLSEADHVYWSRHCGNVHCVTNPLTFTPSHIPVASLEGKNILWLGRFDNAQKNPDHALDIMARLVRLVPDAKLYMVGSMDTEQEKHFTSRVRSMKLEENVFFPGYSSNTGEWYQKAAVFLMTPNFEGDPMTLSESLANGVPVVTYELPYITRAKNSKAVIHVPWSDVDAAARALAGLLLDDEKRFEMGRAAREEMLRWEEFDYGALWDGIFASTLLPVEEPAQYTEPAAMKEYLAAYDIAGSLVCRTICGYAAGLMEPVQAKSGPRGIKLLARKAKTFVMVLRRRGVKTTLCLIRDKLLGRNCDKYNVYKD